MKKKLWLMTMISCVGLCLFGCGASSEQLVKKNMSEQTEVYYLGESQNFYCTLSSGEREKNYLMNGQSGEKTDFALLSIIPNENIFSNIIKANLMIDGQLSEVELEINGLNHNYMVDLEKKLTGEEEVEIVYNGNALRLENVSKDFKINSDEAIEIACEQFKDKIESFKSYRNLNAECYLEILDKKANNFESIFWCFTILNTENQSYSIVISTEDGSILAKSTAI